MAAKVSLLTPTLSAVTVLLLFVVVVVALFGV